MQTHPSTSLGYKDYSSQALELHIFYTHIKKSYFGYAYVSFY